MGTPFGIIADGLAAAVNMTGCAVVLFEAVSRDPSGHEPTTQSYVPPRAGTNDRGMDSAVQSVSRVSAAW